LVPVTINYDRVFEIGNLALEMVSGEIPDESAFGLLSRIHKEASGRLGRTSVIFGNPINLKEWVKSEVRGPLCAENLDEAGLRLSERLLQK
jgi:glycerol-3-phosphate O-acyltransferase